MKLSEYFEKTKGRGVIAAADSEGKVAIAVYAKPHFINERTVALIMADRLIHKNWNQIPCGLPFHGIQGQDMSGKGSTSQKRKRKRIAN